MQAGELRHRVGFYQRLSNDASPDYGNPEAAFPATATLTCAAAITPRLGGESVLAQRQAGTNLVNITVRKSVLTAAIDVSWKARDERKGIDYNIRSIIDPFQATAQQGRFLEMLCERGVAI